MLSRRGYLKATAILLVAYPARLLVDVLANPNRKAGAKSQTLPMDLPNGVTFHQNIIAVVESDQVRFYSAICPHLGCQINRVKAGELVCPCHGSRFSLNGELIDGPAKTGLVRLSYSTDPSKRQYVIQMPASG